MANLTSETLSKANGIVHDTQNHIENAESKLRQISYGIDRLGAKIKNPNYVEEHPAKGLVIAAAVGMVAGSLMTMALRRRPRQKDIQK